LNIAEILCKGITLYNRWPKEDRAIRTLLLAMILSLTTFFVHGILNNFLDTDKAAVPIWGMCAVFIALEMSLDSKKSKGEN
jgi:putative inorganic carbon (HCO3(-)) transporter